MPAAVAFVTSLSAGATVATALASSGLLASAGWAIVSAAAVGPRQSQPRKR